ncbi:hypothetical protein [Spirosoma gilvum]
METTPRKYQKHKTEVKITVKHFVNTELKPEIDTFSGKLIYPLYVRVRVNRQLTKFKSQLNHSISVDYLDEFLSTEPFKAYADNERLIIEQTIKEMKPEQKANFKLKNWSALYKGGLQPISEIISDFIIRGIIALLRETYHWTESELKPLYAITIPEIFTLLYKVNIPDAKAIEEKYSILLKTGDYERKIQGNAAYEFSLLDGQYGFFQSQLLKSGLHIDPSYIKSLNETLSLL